MKNLKLFLLLIVLSFAGVSCSSSDDNNCFGEQTLIDQLATAFDNYTSNPNDVENCNAYVTALSLYINCSATVTDDEADAYQGIINQLDCTNQGTSSNSMNIGGVEFDISTAVLQQYGENDDGSYDWDVIFLGEGLTINNQELDGSGATLFLDLNTNNPDGLRAGTYTFSPNYEREEFTWVEIEACKNSVGFVCESGYRPAQDGTVIITGSGSNTNIEVTVTDNNGETISANYTGGFISL